MNSSEFEQKLGAEPRETAEQFERGGSTDPERRAAVDEALEFEDRLESALRVRVDETTLMETLMEVPALEQRRSGPPRWLAMAAGFIILAGVSGLLWFGVPTPGSQNVTEFVVSHYQHDGESVLARADEGTAPADVQAVLARLGAQASDALAGQVQYIKFCPTPDSQGAHMILATENGPTTVIFMPAVQIDKPLLIRLDDADAQVVALDRGAAAVIGADAQDAERLRELLQAGIQPLDVDA